MTTRAARFTQSDLTRAVRAVAKAGVSIGRVEIDPAGTIIVMAAESPPARSSRNSWDEVLRS
jgi:hypothetical protein